MRRAISPGPPCLRNSIASQGALLQHSRWEGASRCKLPQPFVPVPAELTTAGQGRRFAGRRSPSLAAVAAAAAAPAGAQSSASVKAQQLLGFTAMDLSKGLEVIGVVEEVQGRAETGQAQSLLRVCSVAGHDEGKGVPREEHLIPYVPQIVPSVDLSAGVAYIQPPAGLLELGRQQKLMDTLRRDLQPFTHPKPLSVLQRMGLRVMPTSAQLMAAGRQDLVAAVRRAGGFLEVAQALGLRSQRKPAGYWDDEINLNEELTLFVAAHWSKFKDPESRQNYWYNQITHRISWEEPLLPQRIEIDDEGGYILTEAEEDRVMPSRTAVQSAGRYDLHHAIMLHGGYLAAGQQLDRRPAWPPSQHLDSLPSLQRELRDFVAETGLPRNRMPTASQLLDAGRGDLYQAVVRRGGFVATAGALGWQTQRRGRHMWSDEMEVARELRHFILSNQFSATFSNRGRGKQQHSSVQGQGGDEQQQQPDEFEPLPPGARMPTHRQLADAGRHDLKYALQQHGSTKIAAILGLQRNKRGGARPRRQPPDGPPAEQQH